MATSQKKIVKKEAIKLNLTFEEAMKKALSTPLTKKDSIKKNVNKGRNT